MNPNQPREHDDDVVFNGLDGATGKYLVQATTEQVAMIALDEALDSAYLNDARERVRAGETVFGVADYVENVRDLAQTGWGVIFAADEDPAVIDALQELLEHRQAAAARNNPVFFRKFSGKDGYHRGETKRDFLLRRGAPASGAVDPRNMPYYLLIVGDPEKIPYSFQYQLDVQYAVGRICFDSPQEYAQYARSVVTAERGNPRPRRAVFFGVKNEDDRATILSSTSLVAPLSDTITSWQLTREVPQQWDVQMIEPQDTHKAQLKRFLGGDETPALLFTASHGIGFPNGDSRQFPHQGALVCRDWPGPEEWKKAIPQDFYLAADEITDDARLLGLVAFHFACYGAGTPHLDDYPQRSPQALKHMDDLGLLKSTRIASAPFVARLPQRLLSHPKGGAVAVIGHVERALGSSFAWDWGGVRRTNVEQFNSVLRRLMRGYPVGAALEFFNERYSELGVELSEQIREIKEKGKSPEPAVLAQLWTGHADARGYLIIGDPAARLIMPDRPSRQGTATEIAPVQLQAFSDRESSVPSHGEAVQPPLSPRHAVASSSRNAADVPPAANDAVARPQHTHSAGATIRLNIDTASGQISLTTGGGMSSAPDITGISSEDSTFGLFGSAGPSPIVQLRDELTQSLQNFASKVGEALSNVVADVSVLEVQTFVGTDIDDVTYDKHAHQFSGNVRRRAMTCIKVDGDTLVLVPEDTGAIDQELWEIHNDMVERAQAARAEMVRAIADAAGGILGVLTKL